jgi:rare lipoprotein A
VSDAETRVAQVEKDLATLRSEYAVLSEQAHGAERTVDAAHLRIVNLQRSIEDAAAVLAEARAGVAIRAKRAYMGDAMGNLMAALRVRNYGEIEAYLPYVTRPLEEDRRIVEVYQQRLAALRALEHDMDEAKDDVAKKAGDLTALEARLTRNLDAQQARLTQATADLDAARAAAAADAAQAAQAAEAAPGTATTDVPRGPQAGSGPGPGAGIPDPIDIPPAPDHLPNGVALGPVAGIPQGMKSSGTRLSGVASWYGPGFHGHTTANGETYDQYGFTAAHKTLPFGTVLLVTFEDRMVLLRINDRGPYVEDRFLDLSKGSADALGFGGIGYVDAEILVPE